MKDEFSGLSPILVAISYLFYVGL